MKLFLAAIVRIFKEFFYALGWYFAGSERQKRRHQELARDLEKQMQDIAHRPDLSRDELYRRMRDRDGSVPEISRSSDGSDRPDVRSK